LSLSLFHNRTSNLGLATRTLQWLAPQGAFAVISVFLQQVRGDSAIETGLMLLPATIGGWPRLPSPSAWPAGTPSAG
jgi:hypothetical protein